MKMWSLFAKQASELLFCETYVVFYILNFEQVSQNFFTFLIKQPLTVNFSSTVSICSVNQDHLVQDDC